MEDINEFYINGEPIDTPIGQCNFVTIKEYPKFIKYIPYIQLQKFEIINHIKSIDNDLANELNSLDFLDIITMLKDVFEVYTMYKELFILVFKNDVFELVKSQDDFNYYRNLIMRMNVIEEEEKSPNPEIQYFLNLEKDYKKRKGGNITYESIYTSVWCNCENPKDMTIYQMYANFNRIGKDKEYSSTVLYSSVASDVKIIGWYEHCDLFKKNERETLEDFSKDVTKVMS